MKPEYITDAFLNHFITSSIAEDVGEADHSTLASIPAEARSAAQLLAKDEGVVAGVELAEYIFRAADPALQVDVLIQDGMTIRRGDVILTVSGSARSILTIERLVLNCMQRMSAIASKTRHYTTLISGTGAPEAFMFGCGRVECNSDGGAAGG